MASYREFPLSTVIYNAATLGGAMVVGAIILAQLGAWALAGLIPHPWLVCSHCRQGECGLCPVARQFCKTRERRG